MLLAGRSSRALAPEVLAMAKPILPDELWAIIDPLLPPSPTPGPQGGRPPVANREALTGIPWEDLPC
jgi:hypothetical protein